MRGAGKTDKGRFELLIRISPPFEMTGWPACKLISNIGLNPQYQVFQFRQRIPITNLHPPIQVFTIHSLRRPGERYVQTKPHHQFFSGVEQQLLNVLHIIQRETNMHLFRRYSTYRLHCSYIDHNISLFINQCYSAQPTIVHIFGIY